MTNTNDLKELERTQKALEGIPSHRSVAMLATIKRMSILAATRREQTRPELFAECRFGPVQRKYRRPCVGLVQERSTWPGKTMFGGVDQV